MHIPPGGPATINGILYQMLWSLLEAFTIKIEDCDTDPTGKTASRAFLILEPHGGGGDLLVRDSDVETVQQLKARSDGGAWSLREIVSEVLPDLYRAVKLDRAQKFIFVTEGHMGCWQDASDFFIRLGSRPVPADGRSILNSLDTSRPIRFRGALAAEGGTTSLTTERDLFSQIATSLREKEPAHSEDTDLIHQKLWKLLGGLEWRWEQTAGQLSARLRQRLRAVVDDVDRLDTTLDALLTALAREASHGDARIETEAFLQRHSISMLPLTSWHRLISRGADLLDTQLPLLRYDPARDVRPPLADEALQPWYHGDTPFLILSGESGQGKTWRLVQLARSLACDTPIVLLNATGNGREDKDEAARLFWQRVADHDGTLDIERVAQRVRETVPLQSGCWLFVLVDDVQTYAEAEALYRAFRPIPGVRLALTTTVEVADRFARTFEHDAHILPVRDFTEAELRRYVAGDDARIWHDIPLDIRAVIKRPLLADLYRQLASDGEQAPNTEYRLYASYYKQRLVEPLSERFPMAFVGLRRAVLAAWQGDAYPWSLEQMEGFGLADPDLVRFLLGIGWLRRDERQGYQVWHDRLLNWQVAEALVNAIR